MLCILDAEAFGNIFLFVFRTKKSVLERFVLLLVNLAVDFSNSSNVIYLNYKINYVNYKNKTGLHG